MAQLTINHYKDIIDSFFSNLTNSAKSYYMFIGKPDPWPNDAIPPVANSSVYSYEQTIYADMVYGKLIDINSVSYMIPRYNWVANTQYACYDQNDASLLDEQFYVVTDTNQVYKCIFNNYGGASTVKPSLNTTQ